MNIYFKDFNELNSLELYKILQLRTDVFVVEQNCLYQDMDDKDIYASHILIWDENTLVATARILPIGVSYQDYVSIGRVCTKFEYRGKGIGVKLMKLCLDQLQLKYPGIRIKISAQAYLLEFYSDLGFRSTGETYLEDNIPHIAMIKNLNSI